MKILFQHTYFYIDHNNHFVPPVPCTQTHAMHSNPCHALKGRNPYILILRILIYEVINTIMVTNTSNKSDDLKVGQIILYFLLIGVCPHLLCLGYP